MNTIVDTATLVESVIERLRESYVFPERAARAAALLRERLGEAGYEATDRISADLFEAIRDRHLRLIWHESAEGSRDEAELVAELREQFRLENQGVRRVERLSGRAVRFWPAPTTLHWAAAAIAFALRPRCSSSRLAQLAADRTAIGHVAWPRS